MITAGQTYVEGDCRRCGDQLQIRETWSRAEVTTFLAIAASDRLCVVWRLSLRGLRRGEAPSLRWPDINLRARLLTVIRPGSWSVPGPHRRTGVPQRQADAAARRRAGGRAHHARRRQLEESTVFHWVHEYASA
jgi:integrase